jgi:hypothetical protein
MVERMQHFADEQAELAGDCDAVEEEELESLSIPHPGKDLVVFKINGVLKVPLVLITFVIMTPTNTAEIDLYFILDPPQWTTQEDQHWHTLSVCTMTPEEFKDKVQSLSNDQLRFLTYLHKKLKTSTDQILVFLTGNAGTGKSVALEVAIEWIRITESRFSGEDPVMVGALTGLAAKNIGGKTLHSMLKLGVQKGNTPITELTLLPATMKALEEDLKGKRFLFIDEISMIGQKLLIQIHRRLQDVFNSKEPFGGIHVIFCGDFYQLPPIMDDYCFSHALFQDLDVIFLHENMRQKEDKFWCGILDKIKFGLTGKLTRDEYAALYNRVKSEDELKTVKVDMRLFPTLKEVCTLSELL